MHAEEQEGYDKEELIHMHVTSDKEEQEIYEPEQDSWQISHLVSTDTFCSGITPRYDKPSLKVGELSRMCQPLAQGGDKSRQTTQSYWRVLQAYVLYSRTRRGFNSEE